MPYIQYKMFTSMVICIYSVYHPALKMTCLFFLINVFFHKRRGASPASSFHAMRLSHCPELSKRATPKPHVRVYITLHRGRFMKSTHRKYIYHQSGTSTVALFFDSPFEFARFHSVKTKASSKRLLCMPTLHLIEKV
jgi:hypothetical protein